MDTQYLTPAGIELFKNAPEMKLFNFRKNWHKVKPYLFDKDVQDALNEGMFEMMENEIENFKEQNIKYDPNNFIWIPGSAPYLYTTSSYWCDRRKPKPYSVGWYQCIHACYWLSPFCCALGEKIYPELDWQILENNRHSIAVGFKDCWSYMVFDILNFETLALEDIMDFASDEMPDAEYYSKWGKI
jgi:hypothetical protein